MSVPWVITTAAERLTLDHNRHGTISLTVTNAGHREAPAVVEIVTDPAAQGWFTVTDPQRVVPIGASVPYLVQADIPTTARPGQYQLQARVHSPDADPVSTTALSNRILLDVAGPPPKAGRLQRWWPVIPAALVLVAVTTVVGIVAAREDGATPAEPDQLSTVAVPDLVALTEEAAAGALEQAGLVPRVRHRQVSGPPGPVTQSIPAETKVARGTIVDVVYPVNLSAPVLTSPARGAPLPRLAGDPVGPMFGAVPSTLQVTWTQAEAYVSAWRVVVGAAACSEYAPAAPTPVLPAPPALQFIRLYVSSSTEVATPSFVTVRYWQPRRSQVWPCNGEYVEVAAVDDFGTVGPWAAPLPYTPAAG